MTNSFSAQLGHDRSRQALTVIRDVRVYRFSLFAALATTLAALDVGFEQPLAAFTGLAQMPRAARNYYLSDPAFAIWLNGTTVEVLHSRKDSGALQTWVAELPGLIARIETRRTATAGLVGDTGILLQRMDLDPLIMRVTPPTFDFDQALAAQDGQSGAWQQELAGFGEVLARAFTNIQTCDPGRYNSLVQLIRVIGYLPEGESRSCSAARYAGVVYLAGGEENIVDLEESIVHEGAHQLLYVIGELNPLTEAGAENQEFELPWSGNRRDLFGYLHAYFIYVELVKYFDKRGACAGPLRPQTERVRHLIHRGLELATDDIANAIGLTDAGRGLYQEMMLDTHALRRPPVPALA